MRGDWRYLYRAIDRAGALVDVMLSEHRDLAAAQAFFRSAKAVTGVTPDRVTTDGHDAYPRALRTELGRHVRHRTSRYLNNRLEQDHRGIKGRCRPMLGFEEHWIGEAVLPRPAARIGRAPNRPSRLRCPFSPRLMLPLSLVIATFRYISAQGERKRWARREAERLTQREWRRSRLPLE